MVSVIGTSWLVVMVWCCGHSLEAGLGINSGARQLSVLGGVVVLPEVCMGRWHLGWSVCRRVRGNGCGCLYAVWISGGNSGDIVDIGDGKGGGGKGGGGGCGAAGSPFVARARQGGVLLPRATSWGVASDRGVRAYAYVCEGGGRLAMGDPALGPDATVSLCVCVGGVSFVCAGSGVAVCVAVVVVVVVVVLVVV
jgi:hypothetical protein